MPDRLDLAMDGGVLDAEHAAISQRRQDRVVKGAAPRKVANAGRERVDHRPNGLPPPPGIRPGKPWRIRPFFPSFEAFRIMSDMS